jgi:hypothetical protein
MKQSIPLTITLLFFSLQLSFAQKNCCNPSQVPLAAAFFFPPLSISSTAGSGEFDDVSCSCLAGEGGSYWFAFSAPKSGTFEMLVTPKSPGHNFDYSIWEDVCPCQVPPNYPFPNLMPVVCNSAAGTGPTGIASDPLTSFGVPNSAEFSGTINLKAGHNYFLLISNVANNGAGFDITVKGTSEVAEMVPPPNSSVLTGPAQVCKGGNAVFTLTPPIIGADNYAWTVKQFGVQVGITQNGPSPTKSLNFPDLGTYEVCVTASGQQLGCFGSQEKCTTIQVTQLPVPAGYESGIVCTGDYYVAGNGEVFYFGGTFDIVYNSWQGCDSIVRLTLQQKISDFIVTVKEVCPGDCVEWGGETYCDSGTYDDVQQNQFGCDSTNQLLLIVVPLETIVNGVDTIDCFSPSLNLTSTGSIYAANPKYIWRKGNTIVGNTPNYTVSSGGSYSLEIQSVVAGKTCSVTKAFTIVQNTTVPQGVTATGGNANCYTQQVMLMGNSTTPGVTYAWSGPNGFSSNQQNPNVNTIGSYTLTVTGTNGCTKTATAVVTENKVPPVASAMPNGTLNCNATSVQLNGTGSSSGNQFVYFWATTDGNIVSGEDTKTPTVDKAGTYMLTVTNMNNGCTATASTTVIQRQPVSTQIADVNNVLCFGQANGTATVEANGGNGVYSYQWSNGANTATVTNFSNGGYSVIVTDEDGCTSSQTVTISQPAALVPNATATAQTTFGVDDGTASANPTGGTAGYSYQWSNGETTQVITDLAPGNYTVIITDANGCTASQTVTVSEVACNVKATTVVTNVSCAGAADGSASINLEDATDPITYLWSNGATTQTATNLAGGTYDVSATDVNGCEVVTTVVITEPQPLSANATSTNLTFFNANNGTATANPNGGTAPYTYDWDNGETTQTISGLAPGTYTVVVTDANGCEKSQVVTVNQFVCTLSANVITADISCHGANDGQATFSLNGGTAPFTYEWSNGETTATISSLSAGTYIGTVTDASNCPAIDEVTLDEPTSLGVQVVEMIEAECGAADGMLTIIGTGGTPGYSYLWQSGETTASISGLLAGTYTVAITDANDCTDNFDVLLGTNDIVPPVAAAMNITVTLDANGQATIVPADVDNGSTDDCAIQSYTLDQTSFGCSDLGDNLVTLTVKDVGNNTATAVASVTVVETTAPTIDCPDDLVVPSCDGVATFAVTATDNCDSNPAIVQTAGLPSGSHYPLGNTTATFTATDLNGNTSTCSFVVTVESSLTLAVSKVNVKCFGENSGSATANPTGGLQPISYAWSNGATTQTVTGLNIGTYAVSVTDAGGCSAVETVTITQPPAFNTTLVNIMNAVNNQANGSIDVTVAGGVPPYTYVWKNSMGTVIGNTEDISGLLPGTYTLLATDANGCNSQSGYTIQNSVGTSESELDAHVLLYPNPTLGGVTLELVDMANFGAVEVTAFDVTGRQVLYSSNSSSKQLLDFNAKPSGVYVLKIVIGNEVLTKRLVVNR